MIELRMLYNPKAVIDAWGCISNNVEQLTKFCHRDFTIDMLFNDIMSGQAMLWMGFKEEKYIGFLVTKILLTPLGDKTLLIYALYSNVKIDREEYVEGFNGLTNFAKEQGCTNIDFYTIRDKAFERRTKDFGFLPKYTVFSKEVK